MQIIMFPFMVQMDFNDVIFTDVILNLNWKLTIKKDYSNNKYLVVVGVETLDDVDTDDDVETELEVDALVLKN